MLLTHLALMSAQAATLEVGSGEGAYLTISSAVSAASDGDKISVSAGTYAEAVNFEGKAITIESKDGADTTFITGNGTVTVTASTGETDSSVLSGFTIQGLGHTCIVLNDVSLTVQDSIVQSCGGSSTFIGGGAQINGGAPAFENVSFDGNQAVNGGAIRAAFDADVRIENCRFQNNQAEDGGALHLTDTTISLTDSNFTDNEASVGDGGAIWGGEITLNLTNSTLEDNSALYDGGAIFASESRVSITDMRGISGNEAAYGEGGAIRLDGASGFELMSSTLSGNRAWFTGGAISISETEEATISAVEFTANIQRSTDGGGGGLAINGSGVNLTNSTFSENSSDGHGGALYLQDTDLDATGTDFQGNATRGIGGAWYQANGNAACDSCTFERNSSSDDGGALWSSADSLSLSDSSLSWNESTGGNGGAVSFVGGTLRVSYASFMRNTALTGGAISAEPTTQFATEFTVYQENEGIFSGGGIWASTTGDALIQALNNDFLANECLAADGVAQMAVESNGADLRNNIVAFGRVGAGIGLPPTSASTLAYNDVYENEGGNYAGISDLTDMDGNLSVEPMLVELSIDRNFLNDNLYLQVDSPLIAAGDPELTTVDGRRSFIGAFDRIDIEDADEDGDGYTVIVGEDCADDDPDIHPGAEERCDDEIDNDCDGEIDEECDDTGDVDTGHSDTGTADTGTADTAEPEDTSPPDDDEDREPPAVDDGGVPPESPYKVDGQGCDCSVQTTPDRSGLWWLLAPLLIWVRRR